MLKKYFSKKIILKLNCKGEDIFAFAFKINLFIQREVLMKRFYFVLILTVIFDSYLFSQIGENEIINTDTVPLLKVDVYYRVYKNIFLSCGIDYLGNYSGILGKNGCVIFSLGLAIGNTYWLK